MSRKSISVLLIFMGMISLQAAEFKFLYTDPANFGFNDPTPLSPVGNNPGTTLGQARRYVMEYAARQWGTNLISSVPIVVDAKFTSLSSSTLAVGVFSAMARNFPNAPKTDIHYPIGLANAIAGYDLEPTKSDITMFVNPAIDAYLGLDANNGNKHDLPTILMHELGHGLGIATGMHPTRGTWFKAPGDTQGYPDIYSTFLEREVKTRVGTSYTSVLSMTEADRVRYLNNSMVFTGPITHAGEGQKLPLGKQASHFTCGWQSSFTLMCASDMMFGSPDPKTDHIPDRELRILQDLGWQVSDKMNVLFLYEDNAFTRFFNFWNVMAFISDRYKFMYPNATFSFASYAEFAMAPFGNPEKDTYTAWTVPMSNWMDLEWHLNFFYGLNWTPFFTSAGIEATYQAVTGEGLLLTTNDYTGPGEIQPTTATAEGKRVIINFAMPGIYHDPEVQTYYPTPELNSLVHTRADAKRALTFNRHNIKMHAFKPFSSSNKQAKSEDILSELVSFAGGSIFNLDMDESEIGALIDAELQAEYEASLPKPDMDHDLVPDEDDNCPEIENVNQFDINADGKGDVCDTNNPGFCFAVRATSGTIQVDANAVIDEYSLFKEYGSEIAPIQAGGNINIHHNASVAGDVLGNEVTETAVVPMPAGLVSLGDLYVSPNGQVVLEAGDYYFDNITIKPKGQLITGEGPVRIWFSGKLEINSKASIETETLLPSNLVLFSTETSTSVSLAPNATLVGCLYAPNLSSITIGSKAEVFGSLVGGSIHLKSNAQVHHDLDLCQ